MRTSRASTVFLVAALLPIATSTANAQPATATQRAFGSARQVLDGALTAHGGVDAMRAIRDIHRTGNGTVHNQGQSLRPGTAYTTRTVTVKTVSDLARGRSVTETVQTPSGGVRTPNRTVLRGDDGFNFAVLTNVVTPMSPAAVANGKATLRRDPVMVLATAAGRAETLRDLGNATFDKRPQRVITFADTDGAQIALYIDAQTRRLSKVETLGDNAVLGDTVTEVAYSDYRALNGVQVPHRTVTRVAGEVTLDLQYSEIKVNSGVPDAMLEQPAGAVAAKPGSPPTNVVATKIADGVFFIEGSSHNSLAVVQGDAVVLIEAPQGEERSQAVLNKLAEVAPGKPVKTVVATHYHYDHSGGLRAFIARGSTILTTAGNRDFITKLAKTPHVIKPDSLSRTPAAPTIDIVATKKVLADGAHPIELYDLGPTPHVDEILVAYLPKEKVLFVSDIFGIPAQGPMPPGTPGNRDFAEKLKKLGLDVQTITPGHGRTGTMKDLQKALDTPVPN
jgi:glyoxylase-like metal-dependent hydrolase (beta-lactamase superfamily II)